MSVPVLPPTPEEQSAAILTSKQRAKRHSWRSLLCCAAALPLSSVLAESISFCDGT